MTHASPKLLFSAACLLALAIPGRAQDAVWKTNNDNGWKNCQDGNLKDARLFLEKAVGYAEKNFGKDDPRLGLSLAYLAFVHASDRNQTEADKAARRALAILEKAPADASETSRGQNALGLCYTLQKRHAEAETAFRRALAQETKTLGPTHAIVAQISLNLASACEAQGKYAEAEKLLRDAVEARKTNAPPAELARLQSSLAAACYSQKKFADAETAYEEAIRQRKQALGTDRHLDVALLQHNLGTVYYDQAKHAEAERLFQEALATRRAQDDTKLRVAATLHSLANLYKAQNKLPEALKAAREELDIKKKATGVSSVEIAGCHEYLSSICTKQADLAAAEKELRSALELREKATKGRESRATTACRDKLAKALEDQAALLEKKNAARAKKLREEAAKLREESAKKKSP